MARDDRGIVAVFRNDAIRNEAKSREANRAIFDDLEVVELRFAGSKNISIFPALEYSHWDVDEETGIQRQFTYAERFARQYQQFKARQHQTKAGTPLDYLSFLSEGKKAELRALNIYTAEALALIDGTELRNLGPGGRELKNQAEHFIKNGTPEARMRVLEVEIAELKAKNQSLEDQQQTLARARQLNEAEYEAMSDDQLRDHVAALTGIAPKGNLPRKTLIRMAQEHKTPAAAA